jgi:hypothetical protein
MTNVKLIASQAQLVNQSKYIRSKVQKCCASIYFNKHCITKKIIPKYVNIIIASTSPASQTIVKKAQLMRIKDEIKFLYKKKEKLNQELYKIHLQTAQEWGSTCLDGMYVF